jgi:hypothetical protein
MQSSMPLALVLAVSGVMSPSVLDFDSRNASAMGADQEYGDAVNVDVQVESRAEDIYVTRNVRVSRTAPTTFCAAAGFVAQFEDVYEYRAAGLDSSSRLTSVPTEVLGQQRACLATQDPTTAVLYGKGVVNGVSFTTRGTCVSRSNVPINGVISARCGEELTDLPPSYVGGQLVTNALSSRMPVGRESTPPGYVQSGVSIFRFWHQPRQER